MDRPFGETPRSDQELKKKVGLPRSARTRRSFRSRRVVLSGVEAEGVQYGGVRNLHLVQCTVDSVKHTTLPLSPRVTARRVRVAGGSTSVRRFQTPEMLGPLRRVPQSVLVNLLAGFAFPAVAVARCRFLLVRIARNIARYA